MWSYQNGVYYWYENGVWTGLAWSNGTYYLYDGTFWYYWVPAYQVWNLLG